MKKILFLLMFLVIALPLFAVNDDPNSGCQGVHNLDNLFVEVYWKEGSTWYKIPDSEMDSIYPWRCMLNNSCGGNIPWGESYTCYINGHSNNKVTVNASSVPCIADYQYIGSCWVWKDVNWGNNYNIYRVVIPDNHHNYVEPWLNYMTVPNYSLILREQSINSALWYSYNSGAPFYISTYVSESRFDIRNYQDNWVKTDPNWTVHTKAKKVEIRKRYTVGGQWVYIWESTASQSNFRRFQIGLTKGTGANKSSAMESVDVKDSVNDEYDFIESIDLKLAQKLPVYSMEEILKNILSTTTEEEDYSTSTVIREYSDGRLAAFEIEKIDEKIKNELNFILEGKTIVAVNGFRVDEFKNVEELLKYLLKEDVRSVTFLDGKMMLYEMVEE